MRRGLVATAIASVLAINAGVAAAQTAEQIRKFRELSPEQRSEAIRAAEQAAEKRAEAQPLSEPTVVTPAPVAPAGASPIEQRYAGRTDAAHLRQPQAVRAVGQQLRQFGYDLFAGAPTTFAPATDIPVPADYVVGPGDIVEVQLFGKENEQYSLVVSRDGRINFPQIGAINVAGLRFTELRGDLEKRVAEQMIGVKANVTMGALRSIRIFVLGDVTRPGSYTVSSLSTMTNALFVSGGVKPIGSLRNVQLKRNGRVITRLDLYDLLLRGDTSDDARLQPGDVIFVPPIGQTAGVAGEVRRPAIYELRGERTVRQLIEVAGGLLPTAVPRLSQLERLDAQGNLTLVDIDLETSREGVSSRGAAGDERSPSFREGVSSRGAAGDEGSPSLRDGDVLRIYPALDRMDGIVLLAGHVKRPGGVAWREGMRLTDLVPAAEHLLPQPDLEYVVIRREQRPLAKVTVFSTRLSTAWAAPDSEANVMLEPRDQVFVFAAAAGERQAALKPLLDELAAQAASDEPRRVVTVDGLIRAPGRYPLEPGMRISDLIRASGGLGEAAYTLAAEVTRYRVVGNEKREATHIAVSLKDVVGAAHGRDGETTNAVGAAHGRDDDASSPVGAAHGRDGDAANAAGRDLSDIMLLPHDRLTIKRLPEWADQLTVELRGEVRFPGTYPIKRGERLSDVLERAGGLTDRAFAEGSVFTREELRVREQERLETLARQLETDIAAASLERVQEEAKQAEALATARSLLPQLKQARATGRLVIDLPRLQEEGPGSTHDVVLKHGDALIVPPKTQEVTVIGEVQHPTSHLADGDLSVKDYVDRSGGFTYKADDGRAYVVRANGQVEPAYRGWWIFRDQAEVRAGDTIVVPLDVERMRPLALWSSVTQIVYQIAVSIAVLSNIGAI